MTIEQASATGSPQPSWCMAARCARSFGETSEAMFLTQGYVYEAPKRPRRASRARSRASSIRATPTRPSTCSRSACARWKAPRTRAPRRPAWRRSPRRILCSCKAGDHVVAARALFGSCRYVVETLAPKYGIESTLVDGTDIDELGKGGAGRTPSCSSSKARPTRRWK